MPEEHPVIKMDFWFIDDAPKIDGVAFVAAIAALCNHSDGGDKSDAAIQPATSPFSRRSCTHPVPGSARISTSSPRFRLVRTG